MNNLYIGKHSKRKMNNICFNNICFNTRSWIRVFGFCQIECFSVGQNEEPAKTLENCRGIATLMLGNVMVEIIRKKYVAVRCIRYELEDSISRVIEPIQVAFTIRKRRLSTKHNGRACENCCSVLVTASVLHRQKKKAKDSYVFGFPTILYFNHIIVIIIIIIIIIILLLLYCYYYYYIVIMAVQTSGCPE